MKFTYRPEGNIPPKKKPEDSKPEFPAFPELPMDELSTELSIVENKETMEQLVDKVVELIKNDERIDYLIEINGRLFGKAETGGRTVGQQQYFYDKKEQKMVKDRSTKFPALEDTFGRDKDTHYDSETGSRDAVKFKPYWKAVNKESKEGTRRIWCMHIPFTSKDLSSEFSTEHRDGHDLYFALSYLREGNHPFQGKLESYLGKPATAESKEFLMKLFAKCNEQWLPDYWSFFLEKKKKETKI